jgi:hypothetical protein
VVNRVRLEKEPSYAVTVNGTDWNLGTRETRILVD